MQEYNGSSLIIELYDEAHKNVISRLRQDPSLIDTRTMQMGVLQLSVMVHNEYTDLYSKRNIKVRVPAKFSYKDKLKLKNGNGVITVIGTPCNTRLSPSDGTPGYLLTDGSSNWVESQKEVEDKYDPYTGTNSNYRLDLE